MFGFCIELAVSGVVYSIDKSFGPVAELSAVDRAAQLVVQ